MQSGTHARGVDRAAGRQVDRAAGRLANRQADRHRNRQAGRQSAVKGLRAIITRRLPNWRLLLSAVFTVVR